MRVRPRKSASSSVTNGITAEREDLAAVDEDAGDGERVVDRGRERLVLGHLRELALQDEHELRDTERRDEQDDPGRREESADDTQFDERAQQCSADHGERERDPVVPAPVEHHLGQERRGQRAHLPVREVDDAARPVDEEQSDSEHAVHQARDHAGEDELAR